MTQELLANKITDPYLQNTIRKIEVDLAPQEETSESFERLFSSAERVVSFMSSEESNVEQGRTGVVMMIVKTGEDPQVAIREIGKVKPKKLDKYTTFATGKALAVIGHNYSTSQSNPNAIPENQLYWTSENGTNIPFPGGALRVDDYVISISGYQTDKEDLVAVLTAVVDAGVLPLQRAVGRARSLDVSMLFRSVANPFMLFKNNLKGD